MTVLSLIPLALFAIAFAALVARFAMPRMSLAAAGDLDIAADEVRTGSKSRFGGDPEKQTREPAVAAFPRGF